MWFPASLYLLISDQTNGRGKTPEILFYSNRMNGQSLYNFQFQMFKVSWIKLYNMLYGKNDEI